MLASQALGIFLRVLLGSERTGKFVGFIPAEPEECLAEDGVNTPFEPIPLG